MIDLASLDHIASIVFYGFSAVTVAYSATRIGVKNVAKAVKRWNSLETIENRLGEMDRSSDTRHQETLRMFEESHNDRDKAMTASNEEIKKELGAQTKDLKADINRTQQSIDKVAADEARHNERDHKLSAAVDVVKTDVTGLKKRMRTVEGKPGIEGATE